MTSLVEVRNKQFLTKLTENNPAKEKLLYDLILNPIDRELISVLENIDDPYTIRKRLVQEQCAHFVFRHFVKNGISFKETQEMKVMGLAGQNPILAIISYMRRGLATKADLFEKNEYIYENFSKLNVEEFFSNNSELTNKLLPLMNEQFLTKRKTKKKLNLVNGDYLKAKDNKKYDGFLLDHCGMMPKAKELTEYIDKKTNNGAFFIEATMIDGRGFNPKVWTAELEDALYSKNIFVSAKDSFQYKGGTSNSEHGVAMKTYIWVFEKGPAYNLEA